MGMAHKPLMIGLKANLKAMAADYIRFYPQAKILAPDENDFTKEKRQNYWQKLQSMTTIVYCLHIISTLNCSMTQAIQEEVYQRMLEDLHLQLKYCYA